MHTFSHFEVVSKHDAHRQLESRYEALIASGEYLPAVYPHFTYGIALVILYLLIDHRKSPFLRSLRIPVWIVSTAYTLYITTHYRGRSPAAALGLGLILAWYTIWSAAILVFDDCQADYARIQKLDVPLSDGHGKSDVKTPNGNAMHGAKSSSRIYFWQKYPARFGLARLDWVLEILSTFRGQGWNWRLSGMPAVPAYIEADLKSTAADLKMVKPPKVSSFQTHSTRAAVVRHNLYHLLKDYLILDIVCTCRAHDPYFWLNPDTTALPGYLPSPLREIPQIVYLCRILLCYAALRYCLDMIFRLGPLFFVGLLGKHANVRGEAWNNPDQFGSLDAVFDTGLVGFWGAFWHQTFRHGFQAPSKWLCRKTGMNPKSIPARIIQLLVAFSLSGYLHACGAMTQLGDNRTFAESMKFFLSQAVGIMLQLALVALMKHFGIHSRTPRRLRRWTNFGFAALWLYCTAWIQLDDFNRGGAYLFEPFPVSLLRGPLGLGDAEDTWSCWGTDILRWHTGKHWWDSGIAG